MALGALAVTMRDVPPDLHEHGILLASVGRADPLLHLALANSSLRQTRLGIPESKRIEESNSEGGILGSGAARSQGYAGITR